MASHMTEKDFIVPAHPNKKKHGKVSASAPSNIALIKYWGKKKNQLPANPSLSFTLDNCVTETSVFYERLDTPKPDFSFELIFEGVPKESFRPKIQTFFERISPYLPFLKEYHLRIETSNSFPHSSGIASSASGMGALAVCLMTMEREFAPEIDHAFFKRKASFLARLGSGSACRSIEGPLVQWGLNAGIEGSTDLYGIPYPYEVHDSFKNYQDTILLVDEGQKQVSSTVGHDLMHGHPFAEQRFAQAHNHLSEFRSVLAAGDLERFTAIVESEALTLHAMMMTSAPYFILMKPNTLEIVQKIWSFRKSSGLHPCFTLDAGANVHVLYPEKEREAILTFIQEELLQFCVEGNHIQDRTGSGARTI